MQKFNREDRWQNLIYSSDLLMKRLETIDSQEGSQKAPQQANEEAIQLIRNLLDVFPSSIEPLEDFEGFAVRQFAKALERALTLSRAPGTHPNPLFRSVKTV